MKKKVVACVLSVALALVGCGSNASTGTSSASDTAAGNDTSATTTNDNSIGTSNNEALTDTSSIDNSTGMDSMTIGCATCSSLTPFGTKSELQALYEVYEMLYTMTVDGERYAVLADASQGEFGGYDHEDGSGIYDIYLYDYIYDHNGNNITASDVAFSFDYQYNNAETSGWDKYISAEAIDTYTCRFTFSDDLTGLGEFDNIFCRQFIVSEDSFNADGNAFANTMCGTGPYKFVSYTSGSNFVLEANEDYWQTDELRRQESMANVGQLVYTYIDEESQRVIGLETGTLQSAELSASNIGDFAEGGSYSDTIKIYSFLDKLCTFLMCNVSDDSPCNDLNLRLAIYYAVDQVGLTTALGTGYQRSYTLGSDYYGDYGLVDWASLDNYNTADSSDLDKSKEYLDASSYSGESLTLLVTADESKTAEVIVNMLTAAGITVKLNAVDFTTFQALQADQTAWDIMVLDMAGDNIATVWQHGFDTGNSTVGLAANFADDPEWQQMLETCYGSEETHTSEALLAWWEHAVENGYLMGLYNQNKYTAIPASTATVCYGDKQSMLPGGFTFNN